MPVEAALVTGAASGIGRASAQALARTGVAVLATDIDDEGCRRVAEGIVQSGGRAEALRLDVRDDAAVAGAVAHAVSAFGRLDSVVHSAGVFPRGRFADATVETFDRVVAINLRAAFVLAKAALPRLRAAGGGSLMFLTSGSGLISALADPMQREFSIYGASKAALDRWALGIAEELAALNIAVDVLTPGAFVDTPGVRAVASAEAACAQRIEARRVGEAVAWAATHPQLGGRRLNAVEFGRGWGREVGSAEEGAGS